MRNTTFSYLLAIFGFFGVAGLHRFYLGKPVTAIIYLLTGGLFYIGTIYDLINMDLLVGDANRRSLGPGHVPPALPPHNYYGGYDPSPRPSPDELKDPNLDIELRLLKLARKHGGRVTPALAATELNVSVKQADEQLSKLATVGQAELEVSDDGVVIYDFPSLRV